MGNSVIVNALSARTNFGRLLRQVENEDTSLIIEKRGRPRAVLLSIRDYARLSAPEPEVLRLIGDESKRKGTDKLSPAGVDQIIKSARSRRSRSR